MKSVSTAELGTSLTECLESVATQGIRVDETLNLICKMVMAKFIVDNNMSSETVEKATDIAVQQTGEDNGK